MCQKRHIEKCIKRETHLETEKCDTTKMFLRSV